MHESARLLSREQSHCLATNAAQRGAHEAEAGVNHCRSIKVSSCDIDSVILRVWENQTPRMMREVWSVSPLVCGGTLS